MPKERRRRIEAHEPSVKISSRRFAVQDNAVEHIKLGDATEASGAEILESLSMGEHRSILKKKEKHQIKRDAFLERLESTRSPYSKSHNRRLKRKAKEQIAGGLSDMQSAIAALDDDIPVSVHQSIEANTDLPSETLLKRPKSKPGEIGEGKGTPLTKSQRKRALQMEQLRHPLILSNPEFSSSPFQTIRTHARNTLLKHQTN